MIHLRKLVTYFAIGTIAFAGRTAVAHATELPVAGIDVVLGDFYDSGSEKEYMDIKEFLSTVKTVSGLSFAQVTNYVNIRSKASEESEIIGKLYNNSAATIIEKEKDWYKVKSGTVTGYIKAEYLITGEQADKLAKEVGTRIATVNTTTLKVRKQASLNSPVITLVPIEEELVVKKERNGWVKVVVNGTDTGYVSADYVKIRSVYEEAVSIEEEQERLAAEAAAAEEAAAAGIAGGQSQSASAQTTSNTTVNTKLQQPKTVSNTSSKRMAIVEYALRFEGNPYVWGGTSLTQGADCSGFTQSVFRDNGIRISRTSRTQATGGRSISVNNMQPGDLIFYDRGGTINHVAIYIGNGRVIGASSPETGIRITNYNYRQPHKIVSYID